MRFGAAIPVLNEFRFLPAVVGQMLKVCDRVLVLRSTKSFSGAAVALVPMPYLDPRVEVVEDAWASEHETRNAGMEMLADCDYVFTIDSDEIFSVEALRTLQIGCVRGHRVVAARFYTYWKTPDYRIDPPESTLFEASAPLVVDRSVRFTHLRMVTNGSAACVRSFLGHHLSYVRTNEEMKEKIRLFGHAAEVVPNWYEEKWLAWDKDRAIEDIHPTNPASYKRVVYAPSKELQAILTEHGCR